VSLAGETRLDIEAGVELPRVVVAWHSPAFFAAGDADLDLLARVLTGGKSSRLYKRLVYDDQIAQDVTANQESAQLGSAFKIIATAKPGHTAEELLAAIDAEVAKVQDAGVSAPELDRARASFLSREAFALERVGTRADVVSTYDHYLGDPGYLPHDIARYTQATTESLRGVARAWLPLGKRVVAIVRPVKGAPLAGRIKGAP
jgi:predicted Zn-dependent peptidase